MTELPFATWARDVFGLDATATPLPGERDDNARLDAADGTSYALKVHHPDTDPAELDLQDAVLAHLTDAPVAVPRLVGVGEVSHAGRTRRVRLLGWIDGVVWTHAVDPDPARLGAAVAGLDRALAGFEHPALDRRYRWSLPQAAALRRAMPLVDPDLRPFVGDALARLPTTALAGLPAQAIHNDANGHNVLVGPDGGIAGLLDMGDVVRSPRVCGLAVAMAYVSPAMDLDVLAGYHAEWPLSPAEVALLPELVDARLAMSIANAAEQHRTDPGNAYLLTSQRQIRAAVGSREHRDIHEARYRAACGYRADAPRPAPTTAEIRRRRRVTLAPVLSLSYAEPLHVVAGEGAYLVDASGRRYLDLVNNVAHVGHGHPRVVAALAAQAATLNTNTRYLHGSIVEYARRLTDTFPDPLSVVVLTNSGSEANDLALRMARTATGRDPVLVLDWAYHGNLSSLVELSPYKFNRAGGTGPGPRVRVCELPDPYRGRFGADGPAYAASVVADGAAAFLHESIPGCAGQVELAPGYLEAAYAAAREAGALCVADEVQCGFGRVGTHMWAFEAHGVVPDIVTLGKPIGNGHPIGAVVTTPSVARAFATGMEYFNTYGGNPVSCAVGLAVLDVLRDERLMAHAATVGAHLRAGLLRLARRHPAIGDVRGRGLFLGVDLVVDRATREPAGPLAARVVEAARQDGVLLSRDGPHDNVLKIKPPLVLTEADTEHALAVLDSALQ